MSMQAFRMAAGGGEAVALGEQRSTTLSGQRLRVTVPATFGAQNVIVKGVATFAGGREEAFYQRSLPLQVVAPAEYNDLLALAAPPVFSTDATHVGVSVGSYGSEGIMQALRATDGIEAMPLAELSEEYLSVCDVVILPQPRDNPDRVNDEAIAALREFVNAGGGLMAMRDVIGAWIFQPILPDAVQADGTVVKGREVRVATQHPLTAGLEVGETYEHAHGDHLLLAPCDDATVLVTDTDGKPVVVAAQVGEGRYVACGFNIGRSPSDSDVVPTGFERELLVNAVNWLAGG